MESVQADEESQNFLFKKKKKARKKTEGEAPPDGLHFKDHFPSVAAAVLAFTGCTALWSRPVTRPSTTSHPFQFTPSFEPPKFNHSRRAQEVPVVGSSGQGGLRLQVRHWPCHTRVASPHLVCSTNGEQNKCIQVSGESL